MASPTFGASGTLLEGSSSSANFAVPSGVASGSLIVVAFFVDGTPTVTAVPSGFSAAPSSPVAVNTGGSGQHRIYVYWKRATGNDTGTYNFTLSSSTYRHGRAIRYEGVVSSGDPWDPGAAAYNVDTAESGSTGVGVTPAVDITTSVADTLLFFVGSCWAGGTWTPPSGFTERLDSGDGVLTIDDMAKGAAGNTGTVQADQSSTDKSGAWLGALMSVAGGATVTGTAVSNLGALTASATGQPYVTGTANSSLGSLTATANGQPYVTGTAVSSLGGLTGSATGQPYVTGTAQSILGGLTSSATGDPTVPGVAASSLGALGATAVGQKIVFGNFVAPLGELTATAISQGNIIGTATANLGALTATVIGGGDLADLITIDDIIDAMGRDPYNEDEQASWQHLITIVSNYINSKVRVGFYSTTVTATYQADAYGQIYLREPVTDLASVLNFRTLQPDLYVDWDGVNKLFFLEPHQVVKVTYTYGYSEPPDDIVDLAVTLVLAQLNDTAPQPLSKYKVGDIEEAYRDSQVGRMLDDMTKEILDNYRRSWYSIPLTLEIFPDYRAQGFQDDFD